ncbi:MAG TPA: hypothetical protein VNF49_05065, partial [Candidatus Binataceae bacterium]|nr:hypothetical protein [Candidatus Binataceae bacterium]
AGQDNGETEEQDGNMNWQETLPRAVWPGWAALCNRARPVSVRTLKEALKAGNGASGCRMRAGQIVAKLELWGDAGVAWKGQNA